MAVMDSETQRRLLSELKEITYPDDIVMAILAATNENRFTGNPGKIQRAFRELSLKYPELLKDFSFTSSPVPFSLLLESVLFRLEFNGFLSLGNPTYDVFTINEDTKKDLIPGVMEKMSTLSDKIASAGKELKSLIVTGETIQRSVV